MHVEECCQALLGQLLPEIDSARSGLTIDIGVGTFAFYCQLFDQLRFKTIAVEPLPTEQLRQLCKYRKIHLIESCISDIEGLVDIYIGSYNGEENLNLNSMHSDWWGSTAKAIQVKSMSLSQLLADIHPQEVTCIKIDVEGMEFKIIQQLRNLDQKLLPKVLLFEYGGGGTRASGKGGWQEKLLDGTMKSLEILRDLGYEQTIVIDSAADAKEQVIDLKLTALEPAAIFPLESIYGNIITFYGIQYSRNKIESICQPYQDTKSPPPPLKVKESLIRRASRKMRQLVFK